MPDGSGRRTQQGEDAVDMVIKVLPEIFRVSRERVEKMPRNNKGYDIRIFDDEGQTRRYIEVKSTAGAWGSRGVGMSRPQFKQALKELPP